MISSLRYKSWITDEFAGRA